MSSAVSKQDVKEKLTKSLPLVLIGWGLGAVLAFYLSWKCNSNWGRGGFAKTVFALTSGVQSWSYVLIYFMYKRGLCDPAAFHLIPPVRA